MPQPDSPASGTALSSQRGIYWALLGLALVGLGLHVWNMTRGRGHASGLLIPIALVCMGVGGLVRERRPGVQRALVGVGLVLAVAGLVAAVQA